MNIEEIRTVAKQRPFRPFVLQLDNGKQYFIRHPEIIITDDLIMTVNENGKGVLIAPEAVSSIEFLKAEIMIDDSTIEAP